jgi:hypothetical protein
LLIALVLVTIAVDLQLCRVVTAKTPIVNSMALALIAAGGVPRSPLRQMPTIGP